MNKYKQYIPVTLRAIGSIGLLYLAYLETGLATTVLLALVCITFEIQAYVNKIELETIKILDERLDNLVEFSKHTSERITMTNARLDLLYERLGISKTTEFLQKEITKH